jgi:hypothetical protein
MMAVVRNRRAMITGVQAFDAEDAGRFHMVEVEYTDGTGVESDTFLWEVEPGTDVLSPATLPNVASTPPMDPREFDAMVRAARWAALTPSLPFSGLAEDRPPLASPLYGAIHPEAYQLVPVLRALEMPRVALMLADLPPLNVATSRERISGGCKPREVERWHEGRSSRRSRLSGSSARLRLGWHKGRRCPRWSGSLA